MNKFIIASLIFLGIVGTAIAQEGADWPAWRGPSGNGTSASPLNPSKLKEGMKVLWQAKIGKGYSVPSILGKDLYVLGFNKNTDIVRAMNAETGALLWEYSYECNAGDYPGPRASPAIDGNMVYTVSREGQVFAFERKTGKVIWQRSLASEASAGVPGWGISGSAVVEGDLLLINATESGIALNKNTGKTVWAGKGGNGGYASPVVYSFKDKRYIALFGEKALLSIDVSTGKVIWRQTWLTSYEVNAADPLVFDSKVFIATGYGRGGAVFDFASGKPVKLWENTNMVSHFSSFLYQDGFIYGIHGESSSGDGGELRCLNAKTGTVVWKQAIGFGAIIQVNQQIVAVSDEGVVTIAEINPKKYVQLAKAKVSSGIVWSQPVIAHGLLYIRNDRGDLVCLDVRP